MAGVGVQRYLRGTNAIYRTVTVFGLLNPWQANIHGSFSFADGYRTLHGAFDADRLGGEVAAYAASGKLKVGVRRVPEILRRAGDRSKSTMLTVGLADVNGLLYWGLRLLR